MNLWVTGANGLLGSALRGKAQVVTGHREADIADPVVLRAVASQHPGITHIVNCAAFSLVDASEIEREAAFQANAAGPENLAILAKEIGAKFVHISTDFVFQGDLHRPLKESDPTHPCNYYGYTKLEGEKRVLQALSSSCVIRTSWLFGHGGKNFVASLLELLQSKEEVRLTDDRWNCPTYAPDLADAILQMFDTQGLFQFANRGVATKYEFGIAMKEEAEAAGMPLAVKRIIPVPGDTFPAPAKRPVYSAFDTSKIEKKLKSPIRHWREALREYLQVASYAQR